MALTVRDLGKTFRSGFLRRPQRGVAGISFDVHQGSVTAILGHNGAGKTTTINCILDLIHPDNGEIKIFDVDHKQRQARSQVGYLPERPYFFEHLTGRELLAFYARLLDMSPTSVSARIDAVLRQTGMDKAAGRRLSKYSKGMLQRIGLAQTLLNDPQLLILDEPMSGLDPMGRREVRELLLDLKAQGKTIILSSHIVPDVEMLADSVVVLREGSLVLDRDLTAAAHQSSYELKLHDPATPGFTRSITAHSIEALREVLDRCHTDGVQVMGVEPRRSGLEEIFLEAHNSSEVNS